VEGGEVMGYMKFMYQFDEHSPKVELTLSPGETLSEVIQQFEYFLKASGYNFNGHLEFYEEETSI
jgi:hypothetical protein